MSHWDDRINGAVLDAIRDGHTVITGLGPLEPSDPITMPQAEEKPAGLPSWVTYLPAKDHQPGLRWMRLSQKVRNPMGSAMQLYPMVSAKKVKALAMPLVINLGEGFDSIPPDEAEIVKDLMAHCLFKVVRTVSFGRIRYNHGGSSAPFPEPLLLEVYSEQGDLLWTNPRISLEECIALADGQPMERVVPKVLVPTAIQVPTVPRPEPTIGVVTAGRMDLNIIFDQLEARGISRDEILETASRSAGVPIGIVTAVYAKHQKAKDMAITAGKWNEAIAQARDFGLDGEDLVEAVAATVGASPEEISQFILNPEAPLRAQAPERSETPSAKAPAKGAKGRVTPLHSMEAVAGALGASSLDGSLPLPTDPNREEAERISALIANKAADYRKRTIEILTKHGKPVEAGTLRAELGLPTGGTGHLKLVADAFRRNVLKPLLRAPAQIVQHGTQRATSYTLSA